MAQLEKLILMAEDELTEYSSNARKIEKLRRKFALGLNARQIEELKAELIEQMPKGFLASFVEDNRQSIALPFWGIAGLGLLFGISLRQPFDFIAPALAIPAAIQVQRWGWQLEAKRLVLKTFEELEERMKNPSKIK